MGDAYQINLRDLLQLLQRLPQELDFQLSNPDGDFPKGAAVVCSTDGFTKGAISELGLALYSGDRVELPANHPDGKNGEVFVMSWENTKIPPAQSLKKANGW